MTMSEVIADEEIEKAGERVANAELRYRMLSCANVYGMATGDRAKLEVQYELAFAEMIAARDKLKALARARIMSDADTQ